MLSQILIHSYFLFSMLLCVNMLNIQLISLLYLCQNWYSFDVMNNGNSIISFNNLFILRSVFVTNCIFTEKNVSCMWFWLMIVYFLMKKMIIDVKLSWLSMIFAYLFFISVCHSLWIHWSLMLCRTQQFEKQRKALRKKKKKIMTCNISFGHINICKWLYEAVSRWL